MKRFVWMACAAMLGAIMLAGLSACDLVGALIYRGTGGEEVKAKYTPKPDLMLVLVENYQQETLQPASDELAQMIVAELKNHKIGPVVDRSELAKLRAKKGPAFVKMRIQDIGRALGARQVLYVDLRKLDVDTVAGSDMYHAEVEAKVKIVDVETGGTRWPDFGEYPIHHESPYLTPHEAGNAANVRSGLMLGLGIEIGQLFHSWTPDYDKPPTDKD